MLIFHHPQLDLDLQKYGIEIPLLASRFENVRDYVAQEFPKNLKMVELVELAPLSNAELSLVHSEQLIELIENEPKKFIEQTYELEPGQMKLPSAIALRDEMLLHARVSTWVMEESLKSGEAFFIGGGMHHAMSDYTHGFCPVNDILLGLKMLMKKGLIKSAWVIDVDAHKGDGTAQASVHDSSVATLSIHMAKGWPLDHEKDHPSFTPSTIDIPVQIGEEELYTQKLKNGLDQLERLHPSPDIAIVVQGTDAFEKDGLPSSEPLKLTEEQMLAKDLLVYNFLKDRSITQCYFMAGGYGTYAHIPTVNFIAEVLGEKT
jgi:acetoin utilization deacetylase AcuC-like enzyme